MLNQSACEWEEYSSAFGFNYAQAPEGLWWILKKSQETDQSWWHWELLQDWWTYKRMLGVFIKDKVKR